jgi:alkylation response protein AidB-like acyl-CoA dehydrogenase
MDFGLSDEQLQLKTSARELLAAECPTGALRGAMASEGGTLAPLYAEIAKLGWTGLIVPERFGGAGLGMLDMAVLLEEQGYAAMPGPFLFSAALATFALVHGGNDQLKEKWLRALGEGAATGTVAIAEMGGGLAAADISASARADGGAVRLSGAKLFVPYANLADVIIVAARTGSGDEVALFAVETGAPGVRVTMLKNLDLTRRFATVEFDGAPAAALGGGAGLYARLLDAGAVAIAADSLGGAERALDMAVEYSKVREQFGKPIGSFQALKHAAAEIVADLEPARSLVWYAAYAQDSAAADASRAASMAKARLCEIFSRTTDRAVLMHGGIGFTWEHDIHLWFKRARTNESYLGAPPYHRERVARLGGY